MIRVHLGPFLEGPKSQFCHAAAKKCCGSGNLLICILMVRIQNMSHTFKKRYYSHRQSFNGRNLQHSTTLSSHIWNLKDKNLNYNVKWNTIDRAPRFNPVTKKCRLCLKEKYYIIFQPEGAKLNERSELFSTCRHRTRDLLSKI